MIEFIPDVSDIAKKIGKLSDDIFIDSSNDYTIVLAEDERHYLLAFKKYAEGEKK